MKAVVILALVLLAGCDDPLRADWEIAATTHACTVSEMARVQNEAKWCSDNTGYFKTYCYGSAILRNCPKHL